MTRFPVWEAIGRFAGQRRLGLGAIFISFGLILYHSLTYVPNTILLDQWRFVVGMLARYYSGQFSVLDLVANETSHIRIGYKTLFLLNAILFDLNVHVEIFVGLTALLIFVVLVYRRYLESLTGLDNALGAQLLFLMMLMLIFSLSKNVFFIYSALCVNTFVGWLLFFVFWTSVENSLRRGEDRRSLIIQFLILFLIVFGFSGDKSPAVIGAALAAAVLNIHLRTGERKSRLWYLAKLCGISALLVAGYLLSVRLWAGRTFVTVGLPPFISNPGGALQYVLTILASATIHRDILIRAGETLQLAMGTIVLTLYGLSLFLYFRLRVWHRTWLPLMFMLYSLLYIAELLQARYGYHFGGPLRGSYAGDPQVGMIGAVWTLSYAFLDQWRSSARPATSILPAVLLFAALTAAQAVNARHILIAKASYRLRAEQAIARVKEDPDAPVPSWYCRKGPACNDALRVLRDNRLNIFSN
ncbi:MAG: hypothetical protein HYY48_06620 [Gammaproteobacteria bacterium]|nr:hypothetical protein [Gammaproteobacteria bacterium]